MRSALGDRTWQEAAGAEDRRAVLAVPIGATEQHGPHLPLSTDTDVAVALAHRLAAALPEVVVAPAVAYGASGEHEAFPGTISIGCEALEHLLVELGRSASRTFPRIVLLSAHGGNALPLARATARLQAEGRAVLRWEPRFGGDLHAGHVETSLMLALDAARVREHAQVRGATAPLEELWPTLRAEGVRAASASGVLGDPSGASAAEGERLLAQAGAALADAVRSWLAGGRVAR